MAKAKKAPIEGVPPALRRQIKDWEKHLHGPLQLQLLDWINGVLETVSGLSEVVDPNNPPPAGSGHAKMIEIGRRKRELQELLRGSADDGDGNPEGQPAQGQPPQGQAPQGQPPQGQAPAYVPPNQGPPPLGESRPPTPQVPQAPQGAPSAQGAVI